jgi:hypothetical protein
MTTTASRIGTTEGMFPPVGARVHASYWGESYTVLAYFAPGNDVQPFGWESITVRWDDGRVITHSTPLGKRDRVEL